MNVWRCLCGVYAYVTIQQNKKEKKEKKKEKEKNRNNTTKKFPAPIMLSFFFYSFVKRQLWPTKMKKNIFFLLRFCVCNKIKIIANFFSKQYIHTHTHTHTHRNKKTQTKIKIRRFPESAHHTSLDQQLWWFWRVALPTKTEPLEL